MRGAVTDLIAQLAARADVRDQSSGGWWRGEGGGLRGGKRRAGKDVVCPPFIISYLVKMVSSGG